MDVGDTSAACTGVAGRLLGVAAPPPIADGGRLKDAPPLRGEFIRRGEGGAPDPSDVARGVPVPV